MLHSVLFRRENISATVPDGANLRQVAIDRGIDLYPVGGGKLSCRGKGFCGTCAVEVEPRDHVELESPAGFVDRLGLSAARRRMAHFAQQQRPGLVLACRMQVKGDVAVVTQPGLDVNWKAHTYYSGRPYRTWEKVS